MESENTFGGLFSNIKNIITDPVKFHQFIKNNKKEFIVWCVFIFFLFVAFMVFSDKEFSFFFTLSASIQMFGFFMIAFKVGRDKSCSGLSLHTFICYTVALLARLSSILIYQGYLPYDSTGDWLYQVFELFAFAFCLGTLYMIYFLYKKTYNWDLDSINCLYIIPICLILACLIHPSLNNVWFADVAWTFGLYVESVAIFPQLYLFTRKGGEIENFTSHFVASQGIARIFSFIFWFFSYSELNDSHQKSFFGGIAGYFVILAQLLQIILLGDFLYNYAKSISSGTPMILPTYVV